MSSIENNTKLIKQKALELGFDYCGIAKATELTDDAKRLESWLNKNHHGNMLYMANHFEKRIDPRKLVQNAQSVVTFLLNYYPSLSQEKDTYLISKYAYGNDYHEVIKKKLNLLLNYCHQEIGEITGRGFVDSAPVLERTWAVKTGLGWVGKNGNLITKSSGSYFFIATLILDIPLLYDTFYSQDFCGTCTKCIDACPTNAILPNKEINGSQCISYFTIELKDALIDSTKSWNDWIFGCDVCQDVCPWNRFKREATTQEFQIQNEFLKYSKEEWTYLNEETFKIIFKNSPIKRAKFKGLKRNINFLKPNTQNNKI